VVGPQDQLGPIVQIEAGGEVEAAPVVVEVTAIHRGVEGGHRVAAVPARQGRHRVPNALTVIGHILEGSPAPGHAQAQVMFAPAQFEAARGIDIRLGLGAFQVVFGGIGFEPQARIPVRGAIHVEEPGIARVFVVGHHRLAGPVFIELAAQFQKTALGF